MTLVWRSLLYVPAHQEKHVGSARVREADAVILDLEDAVPLEAKATARASLGAAVKAVARWGADVLVRVNAEAGLIEEDVRAAVRPEVCALVLPKVESAEDIGSIDRLVQVAETEAGIAQGVTRFLVLVESAKGLLALPSILEASARIIAVNLGNEDFARDLGVEPSEETLRLPRQQMVIAAAANGVAPLGLVGQATRFDDLDGYREVAIRSRRLGHVGAACIHPSQIAVLNAVFAPSEAEISDALAIVDAARMAGVGAFALNGRMIDKPILGRAQALLERRRMIERKSKDRGINK